MPLTLRAITCKRTAWDFDRNSNQVVMNVPTARFDFLRFDYTLYDRSRVFTVAGDDERHTCSRFINSKNVIFDRNERLFTYYYYYYHLSRNDSISATRRSLHAQFEEREKNWKVETRLKWPNTEQSRLWSLYVRSVRPEEDFIDFKRAAETKCFWTQLDWNRKRRTRGH